MNRLRKGGEEPHALRAPLDVVVDAGELVTAIAALTGGEEARADGWRPEQVVLIGEGEHLAVGAALGEPYPRGRRLPALVLQRGQVCLSLSELLALTAALPPGDVRLFVKGKVLRAERVSGPPPLRQPGNGWAWATVG